MQHIRIGRAGWAAAATLVLLAGSAAATDYKAIGPLASAASLRSARGDVVDSGVILVFDRVEDGGTPKQITVGLAPDFVYLDDGQERHIVDYKLRRVINVEASRKFENTSLFALVDFRYREAFNRRFQRKLLSSVGATGMKYIANPFWAQSELRIVEAQDEPAQMERLAATGSTVQFMVDGEVATAYTPSAKNRLSEEESSNFKRALLEFTCVHPAIVSEIVETHAIPERLSYACAVVGKLQHTGLTLKSMLRGQVDYPLAPSLVPDTPANSDALKPVLPTMTDALAGRLATPPRSIESYQKAIDSALARGAGLQAFVTDYAFFLQYGLGTTACFNHLAPAASCTHADQVMNLYKSDARAMTLLRTFAIEEHGDIKQAIADRAAIKHDDIDDGYMFDDWIGNAETESKQFGPAEQHIENAIEANPYTASFYKDLGDALKSDFDSFSAWTCYDLGRALPGGESAPIVDGIAKTEQALATHYPQFF